MVDRNSEQYKLAKAASELLGSEAWKEIIVPAIDRARYNEDRISLDSMDAVIKAAKVQGRAEFAKSLADAVAHHAKKFAYFK